ncbi:MAG: hypothetical protein PHZ19_07640 [Candidatus Thermoplasmatota archaeon]|jgi:hypothetical protein|nr:hypothetical protein [Candidatus Thermoplasmatota archaeon]
MGLLRRTATFNRWGIIAKEFDTGGPAADPTYPIFYGPYYQFRTTCANPAITGVIPPQGILRPSKEAVDGKIYIVWEPRSAPEEDQKVGWLVCVQHALETEPAGTWLVLSTPDTWAVNGYDIDWKFSEAPELDPYSNFPRMQWGIVYETVRAGTRNLYSSQVRMLRTDGTRIVPSAAYSFRQLSEKIGNLRAFCTLNIWRLQSFSGTAILADSVYDGDGDGLVDTDDYGNWAFFYGVCADIL